MTARVSFLIPAHNEEKLIGVALESLSRLRNESPDIEVLVGLDGCTDRTPEIAASYPFVRTFSFPGRTGKQEVIRRLKQEAQSPIIVMNDADWHFVSSGQELESLLACFDDPRVGGLGDYFTTSFDENKLATTASLLYLGDAWTSRSTLECKMERCTRRQDGKLYVDPNRLDFMFYVHIYRKEAVDDQHTLCDDGERMIQMVRKGYVVRLLEIESRPCLKASYDNIGFTGFFKQRFRGFLADRQIKELYPWFHSGSLYLYAFTLLYLAKNFFRIRRFRSYLGILLWWSVALLAFAKFKVLPPKLDTAGGWKLRASRW